MASKSPSTIYAKLTDTIAVVRAQIESCDELKLKGQMWNLEIPIRGKTDGRWQHC